jgi:hypothetical protein
VYPAQQLLGHLVLLLAATAGGLVLFYTAIAVVPKNMP